MSLSHIASGPLRLIGYGYGFRCLLPFIKKPENSEQKKKSDKDTNTHARFSLLVAQNFRPLVHFVLIAELFLFFSAFLFPSLLFFKKKKSTRTVYCSLLLFLYILFLPFLLLFLGRLGLTCRGVNIQPFGFGIYNVDQITVRFDRLLHIKLPAPSQMVYTPAVLHIGWRQFANGFPDCMCKEATPWQAGTGSTWSRFLVNCKEFSRRRIGNPALKPWQVARFRFHQLIPNRFEELYFPCLTVGVQDVTQTRRTRKRCAQKLLEGGLFFLRPGLILSLSAVGCRLFLQPLNVFCNRYIPHGGIGQAVPEFVPE